MHKKSELACRLVALGLVLALAFEQATWVSPAYAAEQATTTAVAEAQDAAADDVPDEAADDVSDEAAAEDPADPTADAADAEGASSADEDLLAKLDEQGYLEVEDAVTLLNTGDYTVDEVQEALDAGSSLPLRAASLLDAASSADADSADADSADASTTTLIDYGFFVTACTSPEWEGWQPTLIVDGEATTTGTIRGGSIDATAPATALGANNVIHTYYRALVGTTQIYHVGLLTTHDKDGNDTSYVYYTTDQTVGEDHKTVYAVLDGWDVIVTEGDDGTLTVTGTPKADETTGEAVTPERITLEYLHAQPFAVNYSVTTDGTAGALPQDTDGSDWTLDDAFGSARATTVLNGQSYSGSVAIPRGYTATLTVTRAGEETPAYTTTLGTMMSYVQNSEHPDAVISLASGSPSSMDLSDDFSIDNVTSDLTVSVAFTKVESYSFNASLWAQTKFVGSGQRMWVKRRNFTSLDEETNGNAFWAGTVTARVSTISTDDVTDAATENSNAVGSFTYTDHGFVWHVRNNGDWALDQLEFNGTALDLALPTSQSTHTSATTTLPSGTQVTVDGYWDNSSGSVVRSYIVTVENCYENLTVTGGNWVQDWHSEVAFRELSGISEAYYWALAGTWPTGDDGGSTRLTASSWQTLRSDELITRRNPDPDNNDTPLLGYSEDPIAVKVATGYGKPTVTFRSKDETLDLSGFVVYLNRTDGGTPSDGETTHGTFTEVTYENWEPDASGFYYFNGSSTLDIWLHSKDSSERIQLFSALGETSDDTVLSTADHNAVLYYVAAEPNRYALRYLDGADDDTSKGHVATAPTSESILAMPLFVDGTAVTAGTEGAESYDNGGPTSSTRLGGYNIQDRTSMTISSNTPAVAGTTSNFVFDHWELVLPADGTDLSTDPTTWTYEACVDEDGNPITFEPGEEISISTETIEQLAGETYLYESGTSEDDWRHVVTLRAVWRDVTATNHINYHVTYHAEYTDASGVTHRFEDVPSTSGTADVTGGVTLATRTHTVNQGAQLVSSLYDEDADGTLSLATSIQNVIAENVTDAAVSDDATWDAQWLLLDDVTTKSIDGATESNNTADIYVVQNVLPIQVSKSFSSEHDSDAELPVTVRLQRSIDGGVTWTDVSGGSNALADITLSEANNWTALFAAPRFDVDGPSLTNEEYTNAWTSENYRVVELDADGNVVPEGSLAAVEGDDGATTYYVVGYGQTPATDDALAQASVTNAYVHGSIAVTKRDGTGAALVGAGFTLYAYDADAEGGQGGVVAAEKVTALAKRVVVDAADSAYDGATGTYATVADGVTTLHVVHQTEAHGLYYYDFDLTEADLEDASQLEAVVEFTGLDQGTYTVAETTTPTGYYAPSDQSALVGVSVPTLTDAGAPAFQLLYTVDNVRGVVLATTGSGGAFAPVLLGTVAVGAAAAMARRPGRRRGSAKHFAR